MFRRACVAHGWMAGWMHDATCESEVNNEILCCCVLASECVADVVAGETVLAIRFDSSLRVVKGFFLVISSTVSFLFSQFFRLEHGLVCENPISHITPIPLHHLRIFSSTKLST